MESEALGCFGTNSRQLLELVNKASKRSSKAAQCSAADEENLGGFDAKHPLLA